VREFAEVLQAYQVSTVQGDRYAGEVTQRTVSQSRHRLSAEREGQERALSGTVARDQQQPGGPAGQLAIAGAIPGFGTADFQDRARRGGPQPRRSR
jgi:hypothetical protein